MNHFRVGDIVELVDNNGMDALVGSLARVINHYAGTYVEVDWISPVGSQKGGAYCPDRFRLKGENTMKVGDIVMVEGIVKETFNADYVRIVVDQVEIVVGNKTIKDVIRTYNVGDKVVTKCGYEGVVEAVSQDRTKVWVNLGERCGMATFSVKEIEKKLD